MAQVRFNIGIPRAGSAARDAESAGGDFRSLRPAAGSAARQAEQERREADRDGLRRKSVATLRVQSEPYRAEVVRQAPDVDVRMEEGTGPTIDASNTEHLSQRSEALQGSLPGEHADRHLVEPGNSSAAIVTSSSLDSGPMHKAADKFKSLLRSMFSGNAGES